MYNAANIITFLRVDIFIVYLQTKGFEATTAYNIVKLYETFLVSLYNHGTFVYAW